MKYFLDTEFLEGPQVKRFMGIPYGKTPNTIDLISIGIVCEDGREFYAISKDFNLKEAWDRFQLDINKQFPNSPEYNKNYWIRDNVLKPIWKELALKSLNDKGYCRNHYAAVGFNYSDLNSLIQWYGLSNNDIADKIIDFTIGGAYDVDRLSSEGSPEFYAYYADYDWVVFCWLFGKMIDLPKGFPMYCIDLKQILDEISFQTVRPLLDTDEQATNSIKGQVKAFKTFPNYPDPKKYGEHNALGDAKWGLDLYKFLKNL